MNDNSGVATTIGFGIAFLLAGIALLLQELGMVSLRWSFVLPAIVAAVGLAVLLTGIFGAHRAPRGTAEESS
jgi:ABC-type spermidine/putrescine transport system permease subunit II